MGLDIERRAQSYYSLFKADEDDEEKEEGDSVDFDSLMSDVSGRGEPTADVTSTSSLSIDDHQSQTEEATPLPDDLEAEKRLELERLWELNKAAKAIEELIDGTVVFKEEGGGGERHTLLLSLVLC